MASACSRDRSIPCVRFLHHVVVALSLDDRSARALNHLLHDHLLATYDTETECDKVGGMLAPDARVYLCGRVTVERDGRLLTDAAIGGRQGRLLFAFLGTRRSQRSRRRSSSTPSGDRERRRQRRRRSMRSLASFARRCENSAWPGPTASQAMSARISSPFHRHGSTSRKHARPSIARRAS
jgi:hypothetical protein